MVCIPLLNAHLKEMHSASPVLEIIYAGQRARHTFAAQMDIETALKTCLDGILQLPCLDFSFKNILAIGHRVVHGGDKYFKPTHITPKVLKNLDELSELAPLHNKSSVEAIKSSLNYFGDQIPQFALFDTAFHHDLPLYASTYALPIALSKKYRIRRFGFHGISYSYLWEIYAKHTPHASKKRVIALHLGSGCSLAAIKGGRSIDTSMGLTPMEGLVMSTRSGDIDPAIIEYLCRQENKSAEEITRLLNYDSGLKGVSGTSSDMQVLLQQKTQRPQASLSIEIFCYRILKYIGAYIAALEGIDALIFSGGIGENAAEIRKRILKKLSWYGVKLDAKKNRRASSLHSGEILKINQPHSTVEILVIGTDENAYIAQEIAKLRPTSNDKADQLQLCVPDQSVG